jgi:hypothetical protein
MEEIMEINININIDKLDFSLVRVSDSTAKQLIGGRKNKDLLGYVYCEENDPINITEDIFYEK